MILSGPKDQWASQARIEKTDKKMRKKWNMSPAAVLTVRAIKSMRGCTSMYWISLRRHMKTITYAISFIISCRATVVLMTPRVSKEPLIAISTVARLVGSSTSKIWCSKSSRPVMVVSSPATFESRSTAPKAPSINRRRPSKEKKRFCPLMLLTNLWQIWADTSIRKAVCSIRKVLQREVSCSTLWVFMMLSAAMRPVSRSWKLNRINEIASALEK
mmetsp:Transcript_4427/g.10600  ORF Transcript_4427/g.10600 Transcript_4427/m.10600 type:complete len:216 (+) Transcript_4427:1077-1724(+)